VAKDDVNSRLEKPNLNFSEETLVTTSMERTADDRSATDVTEQKNISSEISGSNVVDSQENEKSLKIGSDSLFSLQSPVLSKRYLSHLTERMRNPLSNMIIFEEKYVSGKKRRSVCVFFYHIAPHNDIFVFS